MCDKYDEILVRLGVPSTENVREKFIAIIERLGTFGDIPNTDAIERFERDRTLDELVSDIERTIAQGKPEVALDRLHTYCVKKFTYLLSVREIACVQDEPLNARFGKYRKALAEECDLQEISIISMKSAISIFERFNVIRNDSTLAHDNQLLSNAEARFIFDTISAVLRFVRSVEAGRFESG